MANRKLTELPTIASNNFDGTDLLYIVDVQTDTSKSITFDSLVGNDITALSAYDTINTTNIDFLSTNIDTESARIGILETGATGSTTKILAVSAVVDQNITDILTVSATADAASNAGTVAAIRTDVNIVSATQLGLSAEADELGDEVESLATVLASASALGVDNATVLNTASAVTDKFTMTAAATSDLSASHTFNVDLGGTTYKILLRQA
tara:strand:- start:9264 stop:9893 length:630 start_codon:yes stop_codon:yes gene_type:complete